MNRISAVERRSPIQLLMLVAIATTVFGCTPSKTSQCNQLANTVNKMQPLAEKFQTERQNFATAAKTASSHNSFKEVKMAAGNAVTRFTPLTQELDQLIQDLQAIKLIDPTLVRLQQQYVQNATAISASFKNITAALATVSTLDNTPKGLADLKTAGQTITTAEKTMNGLFQTDQQLVGDFNKYCESKQ